MDMKQLTTFVTLARTLNYQRAADQLQYAPSTLFKHIQLLEQELGVVLLRKAGRQLQLTAEGERFVEHAQRILTSYRRALESVGSADEERGSLTIGGCEINMGNSLLKLLAQFSQNYPEASISIMTSPNANVPALVRGDMVDLGYYYSISDAGLPGLECAKMYCEPLYLLVEKGHPLAGCKGIKYEALSGQPFFYPHDSCCFVAELMPILRARGVELGKETYLGSMQLVAEHVHREQAVTLLPHSSTAHFCEKNDMVVLDLDEMPIMAWEMLLYKNYEALTPIARRLVAHSEAYAQRLIKSDSAVRA